MLRQISTTVRLHARRPWFPFGIRRSGASLLAALAFAGPPPPAEAQLVPAGSQMFTEDDFDPTSFDALSLFGQAVAVCDFDGDGYEDLAIGAPFTDLLGGVIENSGAVHVAYGGPGGLSLAGHQTLTQPIAGEDPPEQGDQFGRALAGGDFNGDGRCDLAAGAPYETVAEESAAGSVQVFFGSASGLVTPPQFWTQDSPSLPSSAESNDFFGAALAAADFDFDGFDDLAIGVPGENLQGGIVHVLFGSLEGLSGAFDELLYQGDLEGTVGELESGDAFGSVLAVGRFDAGLRADLVVGAPGEDVDGFGNAGWVHVFYGEAGGFDNRIQQRFDQGTLGLALEAGDQFGYSFAVGDFRGNGYDALAIGAPTDAVGPAGSEIGQAGRISIIYGTSVGLAGEAAHFDQDSPGLSDEAELADRFGEALAAGDFDGDGYTDLAIGVLLEDFENGELVNNGAVHALYGSPAGISTEGEQFHGQGGWNVGAAENFDAFGEILATGDFDADGAASLVVGVPREDVDGSADAGLVTIIQGRSFRIFADGFESGDPAAWSVASP